MPCSTCGGGASATPYQVPQTVAAPLAGATGWVIVEWGGQVPVQLVTDSITYEFSETRRRLYMDGQHFASLLPRFPSLRLVEADEYVGADDYIGSEHAAVDQAP